MRGHPHSPPIGGLAALVGAVGPGDGTICRCESFDQATYLFTLSIVGHPKAAEKVICNVHQFHNVSLDSDAFRKVEQRQRRAYSRHRQAKIRAMSPMNEYAQRANAFIFGGDHRTGPAESAAAPLNITIVPSVGSEKKRKQREARTIAESSTTFPGSSAGLARGGGQVRVFGTETVAAAPAAAAERPLPPSTIMGAEVTKEVLSMEEMIDHFVDQWAPVEASDSSSSSSRAARRQRLTGPSDLGGGGGSDAGGGGGYVGGREDDIDLRSNSGWSLSNTHVTENATSAGDAEEEGSAAGALMPLIKDVVNRELRLEEDQTFVGVMDEDETVSELSYRDDQSGTLRTEITRASSHLYGFDLSSQYSNDGTQIPRSYRRILGGMNAGVLAFFMLILCIGIAAVSLKGIVSNTAPHVSPLGNEPWLCVWALICGVSAIAFGRSTSPLWCKFNPEEKGPEEKRHSSNPRIATASALLGASAAIASAILSIRQWESSRMYDFCTSDMIYSLPHNLDARQCKVTAECFADIHMPEPLPTVMPMVRVIGPYEDNWYTGTIPTEYGLLSEVTAFWLDRQKLSGTIPSQLGALKNATSHFSLVSSGLCSDIPTQVQALSVAGRAAAGIDGLSHPSEFDIITGNSIGTVCGWQSYMDQPPPSMDQRIVTIDGSTSTTNISFANNCGVALSSTIPTEFGLLTEVTVFDLSCCGLLTGELPSELGQLKKLHQGLQVQQNKLESTLPSQVRQNSSFTKSNSNPARRHHQHQLNYLAYFLIFFHYISSEQESQLTIIQTPPQLGRLTELRGIIGFGLNSFTGPIPSELGYLSKISVLAVNGTLVAASIPTELGKLVEACEFELCSSSLTSSIPTELGGLVGLGSSLSLYSNALSSTVPSELGRISKLASRFSLHTNSLKGMIPTQLGQVSFVRLGLQLQENQLSSSIPTELGSYNQLAQDFNLANNALASSIPTELGCLVQITSGLYLRDNLLSSKLPTELGFIQSLSTDLVLTNNGLGGAIPSEVGHLKVASRLLLGANHFQSMPTEFGSLKMVKDLVLLNNDFEDDLPTEIGNLNKMTSQLSLGRCDFPGALPTEIGNLVEMRSKFFMFEVSGARPISCMHEPACYFPCAHVRAIEPDFIFTLTQSKFTQTLAE